MKKIVDPFEMVDNPLKLIGGDWMLVSAGSAAKFNMMTASWGGVGLLWNKPVAFIFVRPERYTFEFMETYEHFSLTFFDKQYKPILATLGSKSGRNIDKMKESGLTPCFTEFGTPAFEEARVTMECRKLYGDMLKSESFVDKSLPEQWYNPSHGGIHKMFIAEIVNLRVEQ